MSSPKNWLAAAVCVLVVSLPVAAWAQAGSISGVVETNNGKPLPRTTVRVTNIGGAVTSDSGGFVIQLPPDFQAGDPVELSVGDDWIILSPWEGRSYVPRRQTDVLH